MPDTPSVQGDGKDAQSTVAHAAGIFESLLFPKTEGQDPPSLDGTPQGGDVPPVSPAPDEPAPEAPDSSDESQPAPQPKVFKWLIDGQETELTEEEARLGYLRQQDYTRKTQAVAETRKEAESARDEARKRAQEHLAHLEEIKQGMNAMIPSKPDVAAMRARGATDAQITEALQYYQVFEENRNNVIAEQKKIADQLLEETAREYQKRLEAEEEQLLNVIPEWRDPAKAQAERAELIAWLKQQGYSNKQMEEIVDHRLIVGLRNAMRWDKLQAAKPGAAKNRPGPRTVAPGGPPAPPKPKGDERSQRMDRLVKGGGKVADAAKVFELLPGLQ